MTNNEPQRVRYILYARKSSESEDRQVQSIDDQLARLKLLADARGLDVVATLTESHSAKAPNTRPVFTEMMRMIQDKSADGILCWQINRLSRNPVDSGTISWLLQAGVLRSIVTMDRDHRPDDNVLLLILEAGMANQYIRELSQNVSRGMQSKRERGGYPGRAPTGYANDRNTRSVVPHPTKFALIRRAWDLMLMGHHSTSHIRRQLNERWGFRTAPSANHPNGVELSHHGLFSVYRNPFYAGIVQSKGREYKGAHQPMVTLAEFQKVQDLLEFAGRPHPCRYGFTLGGLLSCGECGCAITAETKRKTLKSSGRVSRFTYYHCTRKRRDVACSQNKYVREERLLELVAGALEHLQISRPFFDAAVRVIRDGLPKELDETATAIGDEDAVLERVPRQLERLNEMYYSQLIPAEEYRRERLKLENQRTRAEGSKGQRLADGERLTSLERKTEMLVDIAARFRTADRDGKRALLIGLGSNLRLLDQKPTIQAPFWAEWLVAARRAASDDPTRFEPALGLTGITKKTLSGLDVTVGRPDDPQLAPLGVFPRARRRHAASRRCTRPGSETGIE